MPAAAGCLVKTRVFQTWQLTWWILAQGSAIEVIAPAALRQEIAGSLKQAVARY